MGCPWAVPWAVHGIPMGSLFMGCPWAIPWAAHEPMGSPWIAHGQPMGSPWITHGIAHGTAHGTLKL